MSSSGLQNEISYFEYYELKYMHDGVERAIWGYTDNEIPRRVRPKNGDKGIDLTKYEVIELQSEHSIDALRLRSKNPDSIIVWCICKKEKGTILVGVNFPQGFCADSITSYKTDYQRSHERIAAIKSALAKGKA